MKKIIIGSLIAVVILTGVTFSILLFNKDNKIIETKKIEVQSTQKNLVEEVSEEIVIDTRIDDLVIKVAQLEADNQKLTAKVTALTNTVNTNKTTITNLNNTVASIKLVLDKQVEQMARILKYNSHIKK